LLLAMKNDSISVSSSPAHLTDVRLWEQ